jgi:signal transduction histidine kinase
MKRPWQVWVVFLVCVVGAAGAMVWLTRQALRADELRREAEAETELEQEVSLALWRMDTALAPIIAEEVIRPPSAYQSNGTRVEPPEYVLLQFEARPDGTWESPQSGSKLSDARCEQLSDSVEVPALLLSCPTAPLPSIAQVEQNYRAQNEAQSAEVFNQLQNELNLFEGNKSVEQSPKAPTAGPAQQQATAAKGKFAKEVDFAQRGVRYQSAAQKGLVSQERANLPNLDPSRLQQQVDAPIADAPARTNEQVGVSRPVWFGDKLLLARRVNSNEESVVQGCWLDWPRLKARLLSEAIETLPDADLVRATDEATADPGRMLAGLPVRLVVGPASVNGMAGALSPTLRWALWMGWGALALAAGAAAALLAGVIGLSERRAAFVSSVTHELRTPLTTFRMYAEMLARGMVPDAARRQEYFNTLQREAERLTLLVENVLAYARLERGRKPQGQDRITLKSLLERVGPRLAQRAAQADMKCDLQLEVHAAEQEFTTDQSVVEQILFNLVDNAAKYAREAENRQIHVVASRNGEWIKLVVRDHGPGIEQRPWGRGSRAFGKSAQQSAETAHGVGLGLALCRRLARQLGGRLEIDEANDGGAAVTLLLRAS